MLHACVSIALCAVCMFVSMSCYPARCGMAWVIAVVTKQGQLERGGSVVTRLFL